MDDANEFTASLSDCTSASLVYNLVYIRAEMFMWKIICVDGANVLIA